METRVFKYTCKQFRIPYIPTFDCCKEVFWLPSPQLKVLMRTNIAWVHCFHLKYTLIRHVIMDISILTSLNWSHNGSKNYTVDSLSRNRCQQPLTNCHTAETAGKWWRKDGPWHRDYPDIYMSIKCFQDVTNALLKRLAPLWIHYIRSCENYYVAMPSSSYLGATKTASTKTKSNSIINYGQRWKSVISEI